MRYRVYPLVVFLLINLSINNMDIIKKISNVLGINKKYINIINDD